MNLMINLTYWAVLISLSSYFLATFLQNKIKSFIFNPLLFSTFTTIIFLIIFDIDYSTYNEKSSVINFLLTPATVCLAVPLYMQIKPLKQNFCAILLGIASGVLACLFSIFCFAVLFNFSHSMYVTILPKSITASMAMGVSDELGGVPSLTVPIVIMTGITGHIIAEKVCNLFRINEPLARGLAIGSASHAMGTAKAMEMGQIEGAMSSLSIAVSGILTVLGASILSTFI